MGHTAYSQRIVIENLLNELKSFERALSYDDRLVLHKILKYPLKHFGSISYTNSFHAWAFLLLTIFIEQEKKYEKLNNNEMAHGRLPEREQNSVMDKDSRRGLHNRKTFQDLHIYGSDKESKKIP